MELVRGIPLTQFCDQEQQGMRQRLELFIQVCQAVQHAHQKGVIHRDLKPTNVLVTMHDATPVPKIIDFGIAKALGQSLTEHTLHTGFAQLVGTPLYMSPEQAEMNQFGVDTRSDVYSLGVMLYELLTGATPFDQETLKSASFDEMRRIIREEEPLRPSARLSTLAAETRSTVSASRDADPRRIALALRGELDWIAMRALEKDRSRRYESASALAADVQRYLDDGQVQACPPSLGYLLGKFVRRNRAAFATASIIFLSLISATAFSAWQAVRAKAAEGRAVENEAKALGAEKQAREAATAEQTQRYRAEQSERQATERFEEAERRRKQAEANFNAALEAVDRMLVNIRDSSLNDVQRIGPLRRKMLADATNFYRRIPVQPETSADQRYRMAQTWHQIAHLAWSLNENQQARDAFQASIALLDELVREQPARLDYLAHRARSYNGLGEVFYHLFNDHGAAEKSVRLASELYSQLSKLQPAELSWPIHEAGSLTDLARVLSRLGKSEEALGCASRALDLVEQSPAATGYDRGQVLAQIGYLQPTAEKSDAVFHRALEAYSAHFARLPAAQRYNEQYAGKLWSIAGHFSNREPAIASQLFEESVKQWREITHTAPDRHGYLQFFAYALRDQASHLRRQAVRIEANDPNQAAELSVQAQALSREALDKQRLLVVRFTLTADRVELVQMLQAEAEFCLGQRKAQSTSDDAAALKTEADGLLTEAIQLCRQLATENSDHNNRLETLLKTQPQHFGPSDAEPKQ